MVGDIPNPKLGGALGGLFGSVSASVRKQATHFAGRGHVVGPPPSETTYTDNLVYQLQTATRERIGRLKEELGGTGARVDIEFFSKKLPDEPLIGADLGIHFRADSPRYQASKGILVQCKKMYGRPGDETFPKLRQDGEEQARKMLRLTPASFFFLFNFGSQVDLLEMTGIPAGTLCPRSEDGRIPAAKAAHIGHSCPFWAESGETIWDLGIAVIPAARVLALSDAARQAGAPLPIAASEVLRGAIPLGVFLVDFLGECYVGDTRPDILRLVERPKEEAGGAPPVEPRLGAADAFGVRHIMEVTVQGVPLLADEGHARSGPDDEGAAESPPRPPPDVLLPGGA